MFIKGTVAVTDVKCDNAFVDSDALTAFDIVSSVDGPWRVSMVESIDASEYVVVVDKSFIDVSTEITLDCCETL